jgi:hypothetical protein
MRGICIAAAEFAIYEFETYTELRKSLGGFRDMGPKYVGKSEEREPLRRRDH